LLLEDIVSYCRRGWSAACLRGSGWSISHNHMVISLIFGLWLRSLVACPQSLAFVIVLQDCGANAGEMLTTSNIRLGLPVASSSISEGHSYCGRWGIWRHYFTHPFVKTSVALLLLQAKRIERLITYLTITNAAISVEFFIFIGIINIKFAGLCCSLPDLGPSF
jgi:hypothetical protein